MSEISPTPEHLEDPYVLQLIEALSMQQDQIEDLTAEVEQLQKIRQAASKVANTNKVSEGRYVPRTFWRDLYEALGFTAADRQESRDTSYDNEQCPVCGFYCLGKGGHGCIDKPSLAGLSVDDKQCGACDNPECEGTHKDDRLHIERSVLDAADKGQSEDEN